MLELLKVFELLLAINVLIVASDGNYGNHGCIDSDDSEYAIHRACNHRYQFTQTELEDVKIYLQTRYINGASIKPQKPPCDSLKVIPDFRCLTDRQRRSFVAALVKVYENTDLIDKLSYIHTYYWPFVNLLSQTVGWHNKVVLVLQKQIEKFDATVVTPYWDESLDGTAPEKSIVWDYFGHSGNNRNDFCVPDGPFSGLKMKYPSNSCLKREWNRNGSINVWETPEVLTYMLQNSIGSFPAFGGQLTSQHFKKHIYIGGLRGDMANTQASNEPLFYLFHWFDDNTNIAQWQLEADNTLTPLALNQLGRHVPPDSYNGTLVMGDIEHETLFGFNDTTVAQAISMGFGDFCYIPDRIIESILGVLSNRAPRYPPAVQRLRDALPSDVFAEFFPKFANNTATELNYHLPDVGNTNCRCKPLPIPINFNVTEIGRQLLALNKQIGADLQPTILDGEQKIVNFIKTLNSYNYCSPYVQ